MIRLTGAAGICGSCTLAVWGLKRMDSWVPVGCSWHIAQLARELKQTPPAPKHSRCQRSIALPTAYCRFLLPASSYLHGFEKERPGTQLGWTRR